jgi:CBS domain-containing protein
MSLDAADAVLVTDHGRILGIVTATDLVRDARASRVLAGAARPGAFGGRRRPYARPSVLR